MKWAIWFMLLILLLTGCKGAVHNPIYSIGFKLEMFNRGQVLSLTESVTEHKGYKLRTTGNNLPLIAGRKLFIYDYERKDGLNLGFSNAQEETCLVLSIYDWQKKGLDYQPLLNKLQAEIEANLPVTQVYPGQSDCLESGESYPPLIEFPDTKKEFYIQGGQDDTEEKLKEVMEEESEQP